MKADTPPKASIITLCYNQLETATKPFLESLYAHTDKNLFELIVVNNGSSDGTAEYLAGFQKDHSNVKVINNAENGGYSKGNNQGLRVAQGEYLFLLNNDLLFSPEWLENMIALLENNHEIGILSVMTNFCGEHKQLVRNSKDYTPENYLQQFQLAERSKQDFIINDKIIFFCWAMRREVFEKVGFLDEKFGLAWYEDDDYTLRVLYNGYKAAIARNIFIFHNHSQTSSKLANSATGNALMEKNKLYFEKKHEFYLSLKKRVLSYEKEGVEIFNLLGKVFALKKTPDGRHFTVILFGLKMKFRI